MKALVVFGTRPEAIKMLPVVRALRSHSAFETHVAVTGQHRQMLDQVFEAFEESPDIDLDLMQPGQTISDVTIRVLDTMAGVITRLKPDVVLVHGDTTTAMAAAMAAFYARVPVAHVEAGLRSHNIHHPWPEEFNRVAIDSVAHWLFAPTEVSADNLSRESKRDRRIIVTGNTGIDALLHVAALPDVSDDNLPVRFIDQKKLILVTGHRRESFGRGFEDICDALRALALRSDVQIVYPVHLNPQVQMVVRGRIGDLQNINLIEPVDYRTMVTLMKRAYIILTDSGGVQEEAPALGKPVLVMRELTERPEAVATGVVSLVGTHPASIVAGASRLLDDATHYNATARPVFPFGDGKAAQRIAAALADDHQ